MPRSDANAGPLTQFTLSVAKGKPHEFDLWCQAVAPMFEIAPLSGKEREAFEMDTLGYFFPGAAITKTTSSACTFERPQSLIAKSGIENILVQVYLDGAYELETERTKTDVKPGDVVVLDLTRECIIRATSYTNIALTIQPELLAPMILSMDQLHGVIIRNGEPRNTLLKSHLQAMHAEADKIEPNEQPAIVQGTAALVAACVGPSLMAIERTMAVKGMTPLQLVRRAIDRQLDDARLGPSGLATQFGMSRSAIYRLFEPLGGVRSYIQQRRLMSAYQLISSPSHFNSSIGTIAAKLGYADIAAFSRAFRKLYRMSPSDVRTAAKSGFGKRQGEPQSGETSFWMLNRWLLGLDSSAPDEAATLKKLR